MHLPGKLKNGDQLRSATIETINTLIDYLTSTRLVQGIGIRLQQYATGTVISSMPSAVTAGGNSPSVYNGYFTLKDVSTYNEDGTVKEYRVAVCDGETWDAEKQTSGDMSVLCNNNYYTIKSTIFTVNQNYRYILIKFRFDVEKNSPVLELITSNSLSSYEYMIGEFSISDSKLNIIQRHTVGVGNGIPCLWLYSDFCTMTVNE